jgi:hypothetical protein
MDTTIALYMYGYKTWLSHKYVHFVYSQDIMNGLGTRISVRKLIHTLKLISHCEWKELLYLKSI